MTLLFLTVLNQHKIPIHAIITMMVVKFEKCKLQESEGHVQAVSYHFPNLCADELSKLVVCI